MFSGEKDDPLPKDALDSLAAKKKLGVLEENPPGPLGELEARGIDVVLCGAASDRDVLEALRQDNRIKAPVLAGELGLRALVEFLRGCRAVICPDSGPRHLANAAGVPVFFFRNLRSSRVESGEYCESEHDFAPDAEFVAPERQGPFLRQRKAEEVMAAIDEVIH